MIAPTPAHLALRRNYILLADVDVAGVAQI